MQAATKGSERPGQSTVRRPARSKEGCLTCRRRKVRCNEQRPRCSHCERLNLECRWRPLGSAAEHLKKKSAASAAAAAAAATASASASSTPAALNTVVDGIEGASPMRPSPRSIRSSSSTTYQPHQVDQFFDYASFMWDSGDLWHQHGVSAQDGSVMGVPTQFNPYFNQSTPTITPSARTIPEQRPLLRGIPGAEVMNGIDKVTTIDVNPTRTAEDHLLMDYFVHTVVPPILTQIETQQKWSSMRQILISMANASPMVRWAIMAFSDLLLCRRQGRHWAPTTHHHYERAVQELALAGDLGIVTAYSPWREKLLATLFFLSYVDLLEGRIEAAHANLKAAYGIFRQGEKNGGFRAVEKRLLSWIRLLDARAVSAGGEGLFLSGDDETLLVVQPSPSSVEGGSGGGSGIRGPDDGSGGRKVEEVAEDIEDVLFQLLYHPGIVFYQKVQSFMGRISKIDPWHRSRGTVEDETEVMSIAAGISKDLRSLYDTRPPLMDYAVAGELTVAHVSANLALTITRAFRTYVANYHASKVHLHRVAYKTLPLARETCEALETIRRLARTMAEGLGEQEALPVNMLWPLLMLGSEESDLQEREWIKGHILRMEKVATNARITAQVLEEVQARQDAAKARVDIRSIMHAIFDSCFAIV
ncbi:fungal-specific transcription factor domain-containing protein [Xylariales sp. PMI_506]|nr:fungal-specific transcription factor domain-containing protein [Xylariales sp. PMI_506]